MQYLTIDKNDTLVSIAKIIGQQNIGSLLAENALERTPKIGEAWFNKCSDFLSSNPPTVTASRKSTLLNSLVGCEEVFEKACLMDEEGWKVFSAFQAFPDALRIPESIQLPYSERVIGDTLGSINNASLGNVQGAGSSNNSSTNLTSPSLRTSSRTSSSDPVDPVTYRAVMNQLLKADIPEVVIDPTVFEKVNTSRAPVIEDSAVIDVKVPQYAYNLPWGKIQIYSSLLDEIMDIPAYPEQVDTTRNATYTSMPDIIYQYEPWITYQNSGPREQTLNFHLHRDLWSGNHLDGRANELIRFCEANTFPRYTGSTVRASIIKIYIDGSLFISGVLNNTTVNWTGPIGLDNWWLEFNLSLSIQEVSETPLNIDVVRKMGLKGF